MVKILKAFTFGTFKTLQGGPAPRYGQSLDGSVHDPDMLRATADMRESAISEVEASPIGKGEPTVQGGSNG